MKTKNFSDKVLDVVSKIPKGETKTYKQVAVLAGRPNAFRAVGNIIGKNYNVDIPCHRVIRTDGKKGSYNRGADLKVRLLQLEKDGIPDEKLRKILQKSLTYNKA